MLDFKVVVKFVVRFLEFQVLDDECNAGSQLLLIDINDPLNIGKEESPNTKIEL